jgi:methyl-accepting chemotaxis protein
MEQQQAENPIDLPEISLTDLLFPSSEAIRTLSSNIEASSEVALQIAATSQQQMVGMDQIVTAMASIRQASQDNVGGTQQVDLAARNLHQLGLKLKGLASRFKL